MRMLTRLLVGGVLVAGALVASMGQDAGVPAKAEGYAVASIRSAKNDGGMYQKMVPHGFSRGVFDAVNVTLEDLIELAYGVKADRVEGAPGWVEGDLYVVHARADPEVQQRLGTMDEAAGQSAQQEMLRGLLAERFKLRVRVRQQVRTGYTLTVAPGGEKMVESRPLEAGVIPGSQFSVRVEGDTFVFRQCPMARLAGLLGQFTGRDLVDRTGLAGNYDFSLKWRQARPGAAPDPNSPELEDALPEQLGLRMKMEKTGVDVVVVEGVEKASAN